MSIRAATGGRWCTADWVVAGLASERSMVGDGTEWRVHNPPAPFQFHRRRSAFLYQAAGIANGVFRSDLVAHEWHIRNDQRTPGSSTNGSENDAMLRIPAPRNAWCSPSMEPNAS